MTYYVDVNVTLHFLTLPFFLHYPFSYITHDLTTVRFSYITLFLTLPLRCYRHLELSIGLSHYGETRFSYIAIFLQCLSAIVAWNYP